MTSRPQNLQSNDHSRSVIIFVAQNNSNHDTAIRLSAPFYFDNITSASLT